MIEFLPFQWSDLETLPIQPEHQHTHSQAILLGDVLEAIEGPYAYTAWHNQNTPVACCGITDAEAWAFLAYSLQDDMVSVTRKVQKVLQEHLLTDGAVYAKIDKNYQPAVRWAGLLGFEELHDGRWIYSSLFRSSNGNSNSNRGFSRRAFS